jgi:hypothetical protein
LLQVWTKEGVLVYERKLEEPLMQWNLSGKLFLFQQQNSPAFIYCLKLRQKRRCTLFKLDISAKILQDVALNESVSAFAKGHTADYTLGYAEGHLFAAHNNHVYYVDVKQQLKEIEAKDKNSEMVDDFTNDPIVNHNLVYSVVFDADDIQDLKVDKNY